MTPARGRTAARHEKGPGAQRAGPGGPDGEDTVFQGGSVLRRTVRPPPSHAAFSSEAFLIIIEVRRNETTSSSRWL